ALGAEVVVDDVEEDGEPGRVARVHQATEPARAAIGRLRSVEVDAIVTPVARARELGDWHQLDGGHAEVGKRGKMRDDRLERPAPSAAGAGPRSPRRPTGSEAPKRRTWPYPQERLRRARSYAPIKHLWARRSLWSCTLTSRWCSITGGGLTAAIGSARRRSSATCRCSKRPTASSPTVSRPSGRSTSPRSSRTSSPRRSSRRNSPL